MFFWPCGALVKRLHQRCFVFSQGLVFWSRIHAALDFGSWASSVPDSARWSWASWSLTWVRISRPLINSWIPSSPVEGCQEAELGGTADQHCAYHPCGRRTFGAFRYAFGAHSTKKAEGVERNALASRFSLGFLWFSLGFLWFSLGFLLVFFCFLLFKTIIKP